MSPRARAQGISWRLIGPAIAVWLFAVIAFASITSPAAATNQARAHRASAPIARAASTASEAPILTLLIAGTGVTAAAVRPARRALARRRIR
jgi:hypothetical protein